MAVKFLFGHIAVGGDAVSAIAFGPATSVEAFLRQNCAAVETSFEASLVAFDVKNKVPRKQATADAKLQVNDFVASSVERYEIMTRPQSRPERG